MILIEETTAPFLTPRTPSSSPPQTQHLDWTQINNFNERVNICSSCEKCIEQNSIPHCNELSMPLAVAAQQNSCPVGKW